MPTPMQSLSHPIPTSQAYYYDYLNPLAILIGSEEKGISKGILKIINEKIKIPMTGNVESLNVSVAASIALFEVKRQRNS